MIIVDGGSIAGVWLFIVFFAAMAHTIRERQHRAWKPWHDTPPTEPSRFRRWLNKIEWF